MDDRIDSWKAIAAYLGREVRTVQRWENERGLPVHRLPGGDKPRVYALKTELDAWLRAYPEETEALLPIRSLAVLPFTDLQAQPERAFFADGMTETLITYLSKVQALKVISRTSVMCYKGSVKPLPEIARELDVDAVVEGTVLQSGERVRISAQLIRAATDEHLWAEAYDRELRDVLALHEEVARAIAREIDVILSPEEQADLQRARPVNPEAHEAHLRGLHFLHRFTAPELERAVAYFDEAIAHDPSLAEAHAAKARALLNRALPLGSGIDVATQRRLLTAAGAAAQTALALDERLAAARATLGLVLLFHDWDWSRSATELRRALDADRSCSYAHAYWCLWMSTTGDREGVIAEAQLVAALDPLHLPLLSEAGEVCYWAREYDRALDYAGRALDLDPRYPRAHFVFGRVHEARGEIAEAIASYEQAGVFGSDAANAARGCLERGGPRAYHRWALERALGRSGRAVGESAVNPPGWFTLSRLHVRVGECEEALACLDRAEEERECLLVLLKALEWFDPVRSHPRFEALVQRIGIP